MDLRLSARSEGEGARPHCVSLVLFEQQAVGKEMTNLLKWRRGLETKERISPLMGAAFCSNWVIFWTVYDAYKNEAGGDWWYESVSFRYSMCVGG